MKLIPLRISISSPPDDETHARSILPSSIRITLLYYRSVLFTLLSLLSELSAHRSAPQVNSRSNSGRIWALHSRMPHGHTSRRLERASVEATLDDALAAVGSDSPFSSSTIMNGILHGCAASPPAASGVINGIAVCSTALLHGTLHTLSVPYLIGLGW